MEENLVIVESPAKAKTIEKFLGKDFHVVSSYGHIRDLSKKNLGIDIQNDFKPDYIVSDDKKKIVAELKKLAQKAKMVWLASDEDREGEAIAWHLAEVLNLPEQKTKRIVFNEITKNAILEAIANPRGIDYNLVDAQQARRVLDRLVGFELSPILWKKVKPNLSAGRVQSVAVRLIVEREREIIAFRSSSHFKVVGFFEVIDANNKKTTLEAELEEKFNTYEEAQAFLEKCKSAEFKIIDITKKPSKKSPSPPFTTSTLQQDASRKLGFSVAYTMSIAQRLYESGKITYMRTDSVNLSDLALNTAQKEIHKLFGPEYHHMRQYKTKIKGAQEAHEAIRPTYIDQQTIQGTQAEKRLYELIWKRTIASQMSDAQFEKTIITIGISNQPLHFVATGEVMLFDGFLKVYSESSTDDEPEQQKKLLPPLKEKQVLNLQKIQAVERFPSHPPRYTEASLVKKLEELGIGRPSTYAPIISTIQQRGYVVKEDRPGTERQYRILELYKGKINAKTDTEITGSEKAKLFPTDIGMLVNDFLVDKFGNIMDYQFTANVEKQFDEIAAGKLRWTEMIRQFYQPFHQQVDAVTAVRDVPRNERLLGVDPVTGKNVYARMGRFGPMVQIGETNDTEKPQYARLQPGQYIETITLEQALALFKLPRSLGEFEGKEITVGTGRFGPYVRHDNKYYSLTKGKDDPYTISLERAIKIIHEKREKDNNRIINTFEYKGNTLQILNGRFGPYISYDGQNFKIPKGTDPKSLTLEQCIAIIEKVDKKSTGDQLDTTKTTAKKSQKSKKEGKK
ncbi:MAG TPA: type I DNA topoisomerase [Bacteroidales bacterium]|nr:type I DNA topoisomerase [Bacteroidales bacterium]HPO64691.1 type I DNA topoisomerase [Bacteroidales bacterium]